MATATQLYGSTVLSKRCFVRSNGHLNCAPLSSPKISSSLLAKRHTLRTVAFDANTAIQYTEDQVNENTGLLNKAIDSAPKNYAKIHDFCLGIPFGLFLFGTGIIGFILSKSFESFLFGIAPGLAVFGLGVTSLTVWKKSISSVPFIFAQTAIAAVIVWKQIQTISLTKKLFPSGFYGFISGAMICFYLYVLFSGGNPPPKKKASS